MRLLDNADYVSNLLKDDPQGFLWRMINDMKSTLYDIERITQELQQNPNVADVEMEAAPSHRAFGTTAADWLIHLRDETRYLNRWLDAAARFNRHSTEKPMLTFIEEEEIEDSDVSEAVFVGGKHWVVRYVNWSLFENRPQAYLRNSDQFLTEFLERYPLMQNAYNERENGTGDVFLWKVDNAPWVLTMSLSDQYEVLIQTLMRARKIIEREGIRSVAMPRLGLRLDWVKVKIILEGVFKDWKGVLYVHE